ncbi:hypothetical protein CRE_07708 [Caenorhabditis remanei]|uniref:Uncharacterized protein n=1 Tax=Caenorhabditis remanei TaxID=31234 RepID=E3MZS2_CAERE|nr:hypothetical protein CRE_07708 [Caenorhabditis remanei]
MLFFLLLLSSSTIIICQTTKNILDCEYLADSFQYTWNNTVYNYTGECCYSEAVKYLDKNQNGWRSEDVANKTAYVRYLKSYGFCNQSTSSTTSTTTPLPTTTIKIDCGFLDPDCCSLLSLEYMNRIHPGWNNFVAELLLKAVYETELKNNGFCGVTVTTVTSTRKIGKILKIEDMLS